jgi:hypothetical protein
MKKILFMIFLLSILSSCNNNNTNPVITDSGLIGVWVLTSISGTTSQGSITITPGLVGLSMTMKINSDKTASLLMVQQGQTTNQSFTWISLDGNFVLTPIGAVIGIPLPYTKTNNKINVGFSSILPSINYNGVTITSPILEFTKQISI